MGPERPNGDAEDGYQRDGEYDGPQASTPGSSDMDVRSVASTDAQNGHVHLPVWLRESSQSFHWKWVPFRIRQTARAVASWSKGPDQPQKQKISPFYPYIQEAPAKFIDKHLPKRRHKVALLALFYLCWLLTFTLVLNHSAKAGDIKGYGMPQPIWCGASFWSAAT